MIARIVPYLVYAMIAESSLASIGYALSRDWKHSIYWAAGATINLMATLLK